MTALASCGAVDVLGLPRAEAAARLSSGDIGFILDADPAEWRGLADFESDAPFYVALRAERLGAPSDKTEALYRLAWSYSSGIARREAGKKLIALGSADKDQTLALIRRYRRDFPHDRTARGVLASAGIGAGDIPGALALFTEDDPPRTGEERAVRLRAYALSGAGEAEAAIERFLFDEPVGKEYEPTLPALPGALTGKFAKAARARVAVFNRSYGEALALFRESFSRGPDFLFAHPETLSDAGKSFQYGGAPLEGAVLFESWAKLADASGPVRFRLLFYAARMRRTAGEIEKANALFAQALSLAPDGAQRDACLWYVLDGAVSLSPVSALPLLRKYVPVWTKPALFEDFLDKYCGLLVSGRHWAELVETFRLIRPVADSATVARYAYVIGRAVSLGYIGADRPLELIGKGESGKDASRGRAAVARSFFRISFESDAASFYYRTLAAAQLGEALDLVPAEEGLNRFDADDSAVGPASTPAARAASKDAAQSPILEFLSAFFDYGLGAEAYDYAQRFIDELSADDIRRLSVRFNSEGRYGDSIRMIGQLARRDGYVLTRADMELMYPLAFEEEIGRAASRWNVSEDQLFGLVRVESAFIPDVVSHAGAEGLAQLMKPTAEDVARRIKTQTALRYREGDSPDLRDPETNLQLGAWYLANLNGRLQSPLLSLFAYNGGITRVRRWRAAQRDLPEDLFLETVPISETRNYASKVLASAAVYGYLYRGKPLANVVADFFPATAQ